MGPASKAAKGALGWEPGQVLVDRYRVDECLRSSSTCELYRVQDMLRDERHLLMRPSESIVKAEGGRAWFEAYAQKAIRLPSHESLLSYTDLETGGEVPFLVGEDFDGRGWEELIAAGELGDLPAMLSVAIGVARGLECLHSNGLIHYNVKPANVLVDGQHRVKIWRSCQPHCKTRAYASPEQTAGEPDLTPATDVWSFAASVLEMFVGRVTWRDSQRLSVSLVRYMWHGAANPGLAIMPGPLAELLTRCLKKDPAQRTVSMSEVVRQLEDIRQEVSRAATRPSAQEGRRREPAESAEPSHDAPGRPTANSALSEQADPDRAAGFGSPRRFYPRRSRRAPSERFPRPR